MAKGCYADSKEFRPVVSFIKLTVKMRLSSCRCELPKLVPTISTKPNWTSETKSTFEKAYAIMHQPESHQSSPHNMSKSVIRPCYDRTRVWYSFLRLQALCEMHIKSISLPFSSSLVKIAPDTNEMISQKGTTIPKIIHMSTILMYNVLGRFDDRPMNLEAQTLRWQ